MDCWKMLFGTHASHNQRSRLWNVLILIFNIIHNHSYLYFYKLINEKIRSRLGTVSSTHYKYHDCLSISSNFLLSKTRAVFKYKPK